MTRRERLMATLKGKQVDRPPVSFYELNGLDENSNDPDPYNIYSHPSWQPLLDLTREKTDRIVMRSVAFSDARADSTGKVLEVKTREENDSRLTERDFR